MEHREQPEQADAGMGRGLNRHRSCLQPPHSFPRALPTVFDVTTFLLIHQLILVCPAGTGDIITFVLGKVIWAHCPPKAEQGAGIALRFRQNENMSKSEMQKCGEQGFGSVQEQVSITSSRSTRGSFVVGQGLQESHLLGSVLCR